MSPFLECLKLFVEYIHVVKKRLRKAECVLSILPIYPSARKVSSFITQHTQQRAGAVAVLDGAAVTTNHDHQDQAHHVSREVPACGPRSSSRRHGPCSPCLPRRNGGLDGLGIDDRGGRGRVAAGMRTPRAAHRASAGWRRRPASGGAAGAAR